LQFEEIADLALELEREARLAAAGLAYAERHGDETYVPTGTNKHVLSARRILRELKDLPLSN
jgi:hypothetical protein